MQGKKLLTYKKKEVVLAEPVLKNIYQSSTYRKDLSWPHLDNEPRVQEKQQVRTNSPAICPLSIEKNDIRITSFGGRNQVKM